MASPIRGPVMCSISINTTVDGQFGALDAKKKKNLKKRLFVLADESGIEKAGALDDVSCHSGRKGERTNRFARNQRNSTNR